MHSTAPAMISSPRQAPGGAEARPEASAAATPAVAMATPSALRAPSRSRPSRAPTSMGHRQVKLEGDGEARKLARAANLCGGFGASDLGPHREGLRADGSVLDGRKVVAVEVEEVVDLVVGGEEPLRLAG